MKKELFLDLAKPNKNGFSRWVNTNEFIGEYHLLKLLNGLSWGRKSSSLAKEYIVEVDKSITSGNKIDRIRLNGFNNDDSKKLSQSINAKIHRDVSKRRCVILGTHRSCDHKVEVDHKDGRKQNKRIMNTKTQLISDFQAMSKPANDAKREFCKKCKETDIRFDARLLGYNISVTEGSLHYEEELGCIGCYLYDVMDFRQKLFKKIN